MVRKLWWLGFFPLFPAVSFFTAFTSDRNSDREIADRLIAEALKPSPLETNLRRLSDEIGGRIPGTPAFQRAVDWGVAAFKDAGADSVHTEEFTIQHSWAESATEMTASLYSGTTFSVHAVSVAWAPALAAAKHVPIVDVGEGSAAEFAKVGDVAGRIALVHTKVLGNWDDLFGEYERAPAIIALAVKGKAKAIAFMATREHGILYRHTNSGAGEIDALPQVIVAREDGEQDCPPAGVGKSSVGRSFDSQQKWLAIETWNVVAEIRGEVRDNEKPAEFVAARRAPGFLGTGNRRARQRVQRRVGD